MPLIRSPVRLVDQLQRTYLIPAVALSVLIGSCHLLDSQDHVDTAICQQTYEFGNYGCARIVVVVELTKTPLPLQYVFFVGANALRAGAGREAAIVGRPAIGRNHLQVIRFELPQPPVDTASFWIYGRILEIPPNHPAGQPLPVFAADSIPFVLRFAQVGMRAPLDTVVLRLR